MVAGLRQRQGRYIQGRDLRSTEKQQLAPQFSAPNLVFREDMLLSIFGGDLVVPKVVGVVDSHGMRPLDEEQEHRHIIPRGKPS